MLSFQRMPPVVGDDELHVRVVVQLHLADVARPGDAGDQVAGGQRVVVLVAVEAAELARLVAVEQLLLRAR